MIRLAWKGRWDLARFVSGDGDFVPAVEVLRKKGAQSEL